MLADVVSDDEFGTMVARANRFRNEVRNLGYRGPDIDANVRARLYWNPKIPELTAGEQALANVIHELLDDSRLSSAQAAQLEREYFPPRRP